MPSFARHRPSTVSFFFSFSNQTETIATCNPITYCLTMKHEHSAHFKPGAGLNGSPVAHRKKNHGLRDAERRAQDN